MMTRSDLGGDRFGPLGYIAGLLHIRVAGLVDDVLDDLVLHVVLHLGAQRVRQITLHTRTHTQPIFSGCSKWEKPKMADNKL